jgi:hypothetical protein
MAPLQNPPAGRKLVYLWLLGRFLGFILLLCSAATVLLPLLEATYPTPDSPAQNDGFAANFSGPDMLVPTFTLVCAMLDFWFSLPLLISQSDIERALRAPDRRWRRLALVLGLPYFVLVTLMALVTLHDAQTRWQEVLLGVLGAVSYLVVTLAAATLLYRKHLFPQPSGYSLVD